MPGPGIACPACGMVMQLHVNGGCPSDSFEEAMLDQLEDDDIGCMEIGELCGSFVELLTLRQFEHATGDGRLLDERLASLPAIDLVQLLSAALGVVRYSIENTAAERDTTVDLLIQQLGLRLAEQDAA